MSKQISRIVDKRRLLQGVFLFLILLSSWWYQQNNSTNSDLIDAINMQRNDVLVEFEAEVIKLLRADDNEGLADTKNSS